MSLPSRTLKPKKVYVYTHTPIAPFGSGTKIRQFTNVRAYLDLGFDVEVVQVSSNPSERGVILPDGAKLTLIKSHICQPRLKERIAYKIGFPFNDVLKVLYADRVIILNAVLQHEEANPGAIHHFEYPAAANVAISIRDKSFNSIWSCHDWESDRNIKISAMRKDIGIRKPMIEKLRRKFYARKVEVQIAKNCKLILMIADHETRIFREKLKVKNVELLPMSWPNENLLVRRRDWLEGGILRMLHVGSPDALVGYYSLKFIIDKVFKRVDESRLSMMELWVAGLDQDNDYSRKIHYIAKPYPQVKFLNFVEDIQSLYAQCDLHLVGDTMATGIRTRIIESFVYGLPVLSTTNSAKGIIELSHRKNILLTNSPDDFARELVRILRENNDLSLISRNGRKLYDTFYSRKVEADKLRLSLEKYLEIAI